LLANQPNNYNTNIEGIVNIINDRNPPNGDLVNSIVKLTSSCITVGPGNAQQLCHLFKLRWASSSSFLSKISDADILFGYFVLLFI
jgi:hypothetical protein